LKFARALRDRWYWKRCGSRGPNAGARNESATIHVSLPVGYQVRPCLCVTAILQSAAARHERRHLYSDRPARGAAPKQFWSLHDWICPTMAPLVLIASYHLVSRWSPSTPPHSHSAAGP